MEWTPDFRFGHDAESAGCPRCGGIWGVRSRRHAPPDDVALPHVQDDGDGVVSPVTNVPPSTPLGSERQHAGG
jgi:hypothetical protein